MSAIHYGGAVRTIRWRPSLRLGRFRAALVVEVTERAGARGGRAARSRRRAAVLAADAAATRFDDQRTRALGERMGAGF